MSKPGLILLSTPRDAVEEKNVIETVAKLKPDLPIERIPVCYEVGGRCVCDVVNSKDRLALKLVARWFKQDKMRELWANHRAQVREKAKQLFDEQYPSLATPETVEVGAK